MSELKPGDRALVVNVMPYWKCLLGRVVTVKSTPFLVSRWGRMRSVMVVLTDDDAPRPESAYPGHYRVASLLRLPPDEEMRQRERETEKPREVSNV